MLVPLSVQAQDQDVFHDDFETGDPRNWSDYYWSSTSAAASPSYAWSVSLSYGSVYFRGKTSTYYVWPVRGGP
jgi:hypothetical protein